ncbi:hypothetical protein B0H10DRAFT_2053450 [Mycena sp. CBHHK59/15]|nr:hypothetical protein B0H10DRAFT_2053450 [Mycena sp. CBHHK59/15]
MSHWPALVVCALATAAAAAQNDNSMRRTPSAAAIGFVVAAVFMFLLCCGIRRRRARYNAAKPFVPTPLPLQHGGGFPHGMQYPPPPSFAPPPGPPPLNPYHTGASEYPAATAADYAPPPYMKDGAPLYTPPAVPPPGFDAQSYARPQYSAPPGPPPQAHISSHSADFDGGFRL